MKFSEFFESAIQNFLSTPVGQFLRTHLNIEPWVASTLATLLVIIAFYIGRHAFTPTPEPDWTKVNPNDDAVAVVGFRDDHIRNSLASRLEVAPAETPTEFQEQLRRLDWYRKSPIDRLNPDDLDMMHDAYQKRALRNIIADALSEGKAKSLDTFIDQVRRLREKKGT